MTASTIPSHIRQAGLATEVLVVSLKLGLMSSGGPVAHIGYSRRELVEHRRWLGDTTFTNLVGLCQLPPGPASGQVGPPVDLLRADWCDGLAAQCSFTLFSVPLLLAFAMLASSLGDPSGAGLIYGLGLVVVAVVAQTVWDMARKFCPGQQRIGIAVLSIAALGALATVRA